MNTNPRKNPWRKNTSRGFMVSVAAAALIVLLIGLILMLHNVYLASERTIKEAQPLVYSAFIFEDVLTDVNEIAGPIIAFNTSNSSVGSSTGSFAMSVSDLFPKSNFSALLESYKTFLQGEFSYLAHANISANFSRLETGTLEVFFIDTYLYNHSYADSAANEVLFGTTSSNGKTNALAYDINMTTDRYRYSITDFPWIAGGDINVTISYTDLNGTWQSNGLLNSSKTNTFTIEFISDESKTVRIVIGAKDARQGALWIEDNDATATFAFKVVLPLQNASQRLGYYYNAPLNYTQLSITKNGMVGNG